MDDLRGKYRFPNRDFVVQVGTSSAIISQTFVAESLRRERPKTKELSAARGAVTALLIGLAFWVALGLALFTLF